MTNRPTTATSPTRPTKSLAKRHRSGARHLLGAQLVAAPAGGVPLPEDAPHLTLRDPESTRTALVTGSISALIHALAIGGLAALAWLAPEIVEVIPIRIIQELPGSNNSAPAPRKVVQRRPVPALTAALVQPTVQPTVVSAAQVSAQSLQMAQVDPTVAPAEISRRQIEAARVSAVTAVNAPRVSAVDLSQMQAVSVMATDLNAPVVDAVGPQQVAQGTQAAVGAQEVVDVFAIVGDANYTTQASPGEYTDGPINEIAIETGVSDLYKGGTGGTGTEENVVRCLDSAHVQRYTLAMTERAKRRWVIPDGTPRGAKVVLRFQLDESGAASKIEYDAESVDPAFGASGVAALRAASPFPPMDKNVRCLAELDLIATLTHDD